MNKKGFTLVELLAVIVIIAMVLIMAIPTVTTQVENSRKKAFMNDARTVLNMTKVNYESEAYYTNKDIVREGNKTIYSKEVIDTLLRARLSQSPFHSTYKDARVVVTETPTEDGDSGYNYYICLIDEDGNGFDFTNENVLSVDAITLGNNSAACTGLPQDTYTVRVLATKGVVTGESTKTVNAGGSAEFTVEASNPAEAEATVSCNNHQNGTLNGNTLTISNITASTTCRVTYGTSMTVLYSDGRLIINEKSVDRAANKSAHGSVVKEYEAMSDSNAYVFKFIEDPETGDSALDYPWFNEKDRITSVSIGQRIKPISTAYWFAGLVNMNYGDFRNLDTSNVIDMTAMFMDTYANHKSYESYTSSGNSNYKVIPVVRPADSNYELIGLDTWNTSKVTSMELMFSYAGYDALDSWEISDLSSWDTSHVESMAYMFEDAGANVGASSYSHAALSNFVSDVPEAIELYGTQPSGTFVLTGLNAWNTSKVEDFTYMFKQTGASAWTWSIGNLSNWNTSSATSMSGMFSSAGYDASSWNVGNLNNWNLSHVTSIYALFFNAGANSSSWNAGNLSNWNTGNVTDFRMAFYSAGGSAQSWNVGDLSSWNTSEVTDMSTMFYYAGSSATTWNVGSLSNWNTGKVVDMSFMFCGAGQNSASMNLNLSNWNTSKVDNMSYMFAYSFEKASTWRLNLSSWNTGKVTDMSRMFNQAGESSSIFDLNVSGWNTSKVTNMQAVFASSGMQATTWAIGDLSNWDTSKVLTMESMFNHAARDASNITSFGALKVYNSNLDLMFSYSTNMKATIVLYGNPTTTGTITPFNHAATADSALITVNYTSSNTNVDTLINGKTSDSHVVKGVLVS